jgi:hypothetical protein
VACTLPYPLYAAEYPAKTDREEATLRLYTDLLSCVCSDTESSLRELTVNQLVNKLLAFME